MIEDGSARVLAWARWELGLRRADGWYRRSTGVRPYRCEFTCAIGSRFGRPWAGRSGSVVLGRLVAAYLSEAHDGGFWVGGRGGQGDGDLARGAVGADLFAGFKTEAA